MAANESKIPVGTVLVGKYRVVREIGRGGMAAVYEAEQLSLGKRVALKVLAAELAASTIVIERFFREAKAAASVKSPYIVDVYDSGRLDDGRPFISMELLEGESLYDRMARVRIIDVDTTMHVVVHTAKGLVKAHAAGIVHRDLKPENIFLTKGEDGDDVCKILDFGLAKFYAPVNPEEKSQKRLTREGAVFGTPAYMSPEQVKGHGNVDHRADLWALGCMAYECLIGRPVWNMDQGVAMTFAAIATGPIPVPSRARSDLPAGFDAWFKKCLERDPARRYQSAKELADGFVEAWGQRPTSSASFPNLNPVPSSGSMRPPPAIHAGGLEAQELSSNVLDSVRPGVPVAPGSKREVNGRNDDSVPVGARASTEVPPSEPQTPIPHAKPSPLRMALSGVSLVGSVTLAIFVWVKFLSPQVFAPIVQSTAAPTPSLEPSGGATTGQVPAEEPKWAPTIAEGQRLFTAGDLAAAQRKFKEAQDIPGGANVGKVFADQSRWAERSTAPCKPVAFSRPRLWSLGRNGERPTIAATSKGAVVAWTDDHEVKERDHVYGVMIDMTGRPIGPIRDLTPEATLAARPLLNAVGSDRLVLLFWDENKKDSDIRVRLLDGDGRIDLYKGQSIRVGAAPRPRQSWPSIDKGPNGFWVVWQDERDKENEHDLFARRLSNDLEPVGGEMRLTDYVPPPKKNAALPAPRVSAKFPSVAVAANTLMVAFRLERDRERNIARLRVPLDGLEKGLDESRDPNRSDRFLGEDVVLVSEEKAPAEAPAMACGLDGCFVVWHGETGGAFAAMIDPKEGRYVWRKRISDRSGRPSLGVNEGRVAVAYYDRGSVKLAFLTFDGVGPASILFRIHDMSVPRPTVAAGSQKNEWYLAWQDSDVPRGLAEVYAARVVCR
jgi:serine/threonine-protein kinase